VSISGRVSVSQFSVAVMATSLMSGLCSIANFIEQPLRSYGDDVIAAKRSPEYCDNTRAIVLAPSASEIGLVARR
jgi:hypothetical protein